MSLPAFDEESLVALGEFNLEDIQIGMKQFSIWYVKTVAHPYGDTTWYAIVSPGLINFNKLLLSFECIVQGAI